MTPLLAIRFGTTTAVALVTLPHAAATAVRCWRLRAHAATATGLLAIVGERLLLGLSPRRFGQTIGGAIGALGIWMLVMPV